MAAAATDKFRKGARKWVGQIGAGGVADDSVTTIPLASTTGLPTDTGVDVVIDRVDSSGTKTPSLEETVTGVVSGSNLVTCVRGVEGTAQAHLAGAVVEVVLTNSMLEDMIDGILVEHGQDGTHGAVTAASATVTGNITTCDLIASGITANTVVSRTTDSNLNLSGNGTGVVDATDGLKIGTSTVTADDILDEDDMSSNSATALSTQQSIKAYADRETNVAFWVVQTTGQTIPNNSWTKVTFDNEGFDLGSDYDSTTDHDFTVPYAGIYIFTASAYFVNPGDGTLCGVRIAVDGVNVVQQMVESHDAAADPLAVCSIVYNCTVNQLITVEAYQNSGSDKTLSTSARHNGFSGALIHRTD